MLTSLLKYCLQDGSRWCDLSSPGLLNASCVHGVGCLLTHSCWWPVSLNHTTTGRATHPDVQRLHLQSTFDDLPGGEVDMKPKHLGEV